MGIRYLLVLCPSILFKCMFSQFRIFFGLWSEGGIVKDHKKHGYFFGILPLIGNVFCKNYLVLLIQLQNNHGCRIKALRNWAESWSRMKTCQTVVWSWPANTTFFKGEGSWKMLEEHHIVRPAPGLWSRRGYWQHRPRRVWLLGGIQEERAHSQRRHPTMPVCPSQWRIGEG